MLATGVVLATLLGVVLSVPAAVEPPGESPADGVAMDPRIASIDVDVRIDPDRGLMVQNSSIEVRGYGLRSLSLAINPGLTIERVRAAGAVVEFKKVGDRLDLFMSPPLEGRRVLRFRITGSPRAADGTARIDRRRVLLAPGDNWHPTLPGFWADARVVAHVPEGWTAVAPGSTGGDDPSPRTWRSGRPLRGLALVAAPGLRISETELGGVPLRVVAPPGLPGADTIGPRIRQPMAWLSAALAPYPFDGFTLVMLPDLDERVRAGGMLAVAADTPIDTPSDGADLLAGQWFGEFLAGDGPWIDSFAAWYATVYARDRSLPLPAAIQRLRGEYFRLSSSRDVSLSRADAEAPEAVLRGKGSAAPDMVRLAVGDRQVQEAVRELFMMPVSPPLSLGQMRSVFEKHAGVTPLRSFAEWFDRTGAPEFESAMESRPAANGEWRVDVVLKQIRGVYSLPVEIELIGREQRHREVVRVENEVTEVSYSLGFKPLKIEIDPSGKLFRHDSG